MYALPEIDPAFEQDDWGTPDDFFG